MMLHFSAQDAITFTGPIRKLLLFLLSGLYEGCSASFNGANWMRTRSSSRAVNYFSQRCIFIRVFHQRLFDQFNKTGKTKACTVCKTAEVRSARHSKICRNPNVPAERRHVGIVPPPLQGKQSLCRPCGVTRAWCNTPPAVTAPWSSPNANQPSVELLLDLMHPSFLLPS